MFAGSDLEHGIELLGRNFLSDDFEKVPDNKE